MSSAEVDGYPLSERFLYEQVAGELRRQIEDGLLAPGSKISTHKDLAHQFGVSAITVRRAIRDLILEGLLVSRQGIGVFARNQHRIVRSLSAAPTTPFAAEIRKAGVEPGIRQLSFSLLPAPADVAAQLKLNAGALICRYEKLILGDSEPVSREVTYLPQDIGLKLQSELSQAFVFSLLKEKGITFDHIDFQIQGVGASESDARVFGLAVGFPMIVVDYTLVRPNGSAIATGVIISRSDRMAFNLRVSGEPGASTKLFNGGTQPGS